jgi:hypothetical protein
LSLKLDQSLIGMKEVVIGSAEHEGREAGESLMREIPADNKNWNKYQPLKMRAMITTICYFRCILATREKKRSG